MFAVILYIHHSSEKKRFMLEEMFQQNASKCDILLEYENLRSFFRFPFRSTLFFSQMNAQVYVDWEKIK